MHPFVGATNERTTLACAHRIFHAQAVLGCAIFIQRAEEEQVNPCDGSEEPPSNPWGEYANFIASMCYSSFTHAVFHWMPARDKRALLDQLWVCRKATLQMLQGNAAKATFGGQAF